MENCCEQCGIMVVQNPGHKHKRFCSDKCRMLWWNSHQDLVKRKANYEFTCARCGKAFISYGNKSRKYCCQECYIEDRFGKKVRCAQMKLQDIPFDTKR